MSEKYICECWNDEPPVDCSGCSCVKIHDERIKDYFINNDMCDLYVPVPVTEELEQIIFEEAHRRVMYCTMCQALEFFDCICDNE